MMQVKKIERIAFPGKEAFEAGYVKPGIPAIITDVASHLPAVTRWSDLDYLKRLVGHCKAPVSVFDENTSAVGKSVFGAVVPRLGGREYQMMRTDAFIDLMADPHTPQGKYYLADVVIDKHLPALREDFGRPDLIDEQSGDGQPITFLYFGRDSFTGNHMHFDTHTLLTQIVGEKHIRLFSPDQTSQLHAPPIWRRSESPFHSPVNLDHPDLEKHPRFRHARQLTCTLKPGEMLYIPTYWWHAVYSPGLNLAVGMGYTNRPGWFRRYPRNWFRCAVAMTFVSLVNKLGWRADKTPSKTAEEV